MDPKPITILISDIKESSSKELKHKLELKENIKVLSITHDGLDTYNKIVELKPDIAIINFIMPNLDALGVLERLYCDTSNDIHSKCIIISPISNERIAKLAIDLGAQYYLLKPFDIKSLINRIKEILDKNYVDTKNINVNKYLMSNNNNSNIHYEITKTLLKLGMSANIRGYYYIRDAIIFCIQDKSLVNYVTKDLYIKIAKKHNTTPSKVERAIRHAIEVTFTRGNKTYIEELFVYNRKNTKPTNSEFITLIVDKYKNLPFNPNAF